ncbi:MAG: TRAP transporter substrate-binding protein [Bdellovibrionales bacterium]
MRSLIRLTLLSSIVLWGSVQVHAAETKAAPYKVRWLLAHEPVGLFLRAAEHFAKEVEAKSKGQIDVEVLTLAQYAEKYNSGQVPTQREVVRMLQNGDVEMSQTYTTTLGMLNRDLYVLDLPFLFRDHQHAQKVLEGKVGEKLLAGMTRGRVQGLAFTYSGGYRIIPAKTALAGVADLKGAKVRTSNSPVAQDTFLAVGAVPVPMELDEVGNAAKQGKIEGAESTYPRFYAMKQNEFSNVLNDTHHSLFLTSIVVGTGFWNKLPADLQKVVREVATSAARLERKESIEDARITKEKCRKEGIKVVEWPKTEQEKFKTATEKVYKKYNADFFSENFVAQIQNTK